MFWPIILLAACASGTARAQEVSTDPDACATFCVNSAGTEAQNALVKCNRGPVTAVDVAKCICGEKVIFSELQSCVELACPVFKDNFESGCDKLRDVKSSGAGEASHGGISRLVASCAVVVGSLLL